MLVNGIGWQSMLPAGFDRLIKFIGGYIIMPRGIQLNPLEDNWTAAKRILASKFGMGEGVEVVRDVTKASAILKNFLYNNVYLNIDIYSGFRLNAKVQLSVKEDRDDIKLITLNRNKFIFRFDGMLVWNIPGGTVALFLAVKDIVPVPITAINHNGVSFDRFLEYKDQLVKSPIEINVFYDLVGEGNIFDFFTIYRFYTGGIGALITASPNNLYDVYGSTYGICNIMKYKLSDLEKQITFSMESQSGATADAQLPPTAP